MDVEKVVAWRASMPNLPQVGCSLLFEQVSLHEVVDGLDDLKLQVVLV